jgi:hypothetical protein
MRILRGMAITLGVLAILLVIAVVGEFWWAGVEPRRPSGVPNDGVFLWAPYRGIPKRIKGIWLNCWQESTGSDQCRVSAQDGEVIFKGEYVPYGQTAPVPSSRLRIDPEMSRRYLLGVGGGFAPLVYLTNGQILIPASKYKEGARLLGLNPTR